MARGIVTVSPTEAGAKGASTVQPDDYLDRVAKYIPGETVALWAAVGGIISTAPPGSQPILLWITLAGGVVLTAFYMWTRTKKQGPSVQRTMTVISTIAFVVWVFAVGGPFAAFDWYHPSFGSFALIIYSFAVGAVKPGAQVGG